MTAYTADDFKNARFATRSNPDGDGSWVAMRSETYSEPWETPHDSFHDFEMACDGWVPVQENPRPLTADDITDEMVERAWDFLTGVGETWSHHEVLALLRAALTEPPARPEGAEELKHPVIVGLAGMDSTRVHGLTQEDIEGLCDRLAERGVRVTGAES